MKKITDYKEVSPLVLKYFKRGVITNNFLTADDYKSEIEEERLFYDCGEDYLNIYVKRDGFYQLYFHALTEDVIFPEIKEKIVCDISGYSGNLLIKNGFLEVLERVRLERNNDAEGESFIKAIKDDAEKISELMNSCFDKFTGYVPNFTQIQSECEKGLFYKIEKNDKIAGILRTGRNGKTAQIKHLCVSEDFRGEGIAKRLCAEFLKENTKVTVWTGRENKAALNLYKSFGFTEDKTNSTVYMKG